MSIFLFTFYIPLSKVVQHTSLPAYRINRLRIRRVSHSCWPPRSLHRQSRVHARILHCAKAAGSFPARGFSVSFHIIFGRWPAQNT